MSRLLSRTLILAVSLVILSTTAFAGPIEMHAKGEKLPTTHQGPFVTTGDGDILAVGRSKAFISGDKGKTWTAYPLFKDNKKHQARDERALIRTRDGVVVFGWMNERGRRAGKWGKGGEAEAAKWIIPTCISRSLDDGKTWEEPIKIQDRWCGAIRCLIELKSGRLVLVGQKLIPWQHVTLTYVSDDKGKSWKPSNEIVLGGHHDHDGAMEATIVERKDGSIHMLIRTTKGWQYEAVSTDEGLTWKNVRNSGIQSNTCCATYSRLADGTISLLWNRMLKQKPTDMGSREEMSIAFSKDEGKTWSKPQIVAARYAKAGDSWGNRILGYPYLYETKPGKLWITTMQGGLRMKIKQADLDTTPDSADSIRPKSIVMLGDSTTARRTGLKKTYARRVAEALCDEGIDTWVTNSGVPGDTTEGARKRFKKDVLDHNPHLVVIQLGANDSAIDVWKNPPSKKSRVSLKRYEENLRYMIGELKKRGVPVILMTSNHFRWTPQLKKLYGKPPYDANEPMSFTDTTLRKYGEAVRRIAKSENLPLVDVLEIYDNYEKKTGKSVDTLLLDGMHPNDAGHEQVAKPLVEAIRKALK